VTEVAFRLGARDLQLPGSAANAFKQVTRVADDDVLGVNLEAQGGRVLVRS